MVNGTENSICRSITRGVTADFNCVYAYLEGKTQPSTCGDRCNLLNHATLML